MDNYSALCFDILIHAHSLTSLSSRCKHRAMSSFPLHTTPGHLYEPNFGPASDLISSSMGDKPEHQDRLNNFMDNVICTRSPVEHTEHCQAYSLNMYIPYPVIQDGYITSGIRNVQSKSMTTLLGTLPLTTVAFAWLARRYGTNPSVISLEVYYIHTVQ